MIKLDLVNSSIFAAHLQTVNNKILPALNTDLPDIIELLETLNLDMEEVHYSEFFVCKDKGELIAAGRVREYEDGVFELCSLGVLEDYRGAGVGIDIVKALLQKHSLDSVYVVTEIPTYFEKSGFVLSNVKSERLLDKQKRCVEEYACSNPVFMVSKHI
jgi:N-acetylglutamate synthase-like GNAT family acetyltransferase